MTQLTCGNIGINVYDKAGGGFRKGSFYVVKFLNPRKRDFGHSKIICFYEKTRNGQYKQIYEEK